MPGIFLGVTFQAHVFFVEGGGGEGVHNMKLRWIPHHVYCEYPPPLGSSPWWALARKQRNTEAIKIRKKPAPFNFSKSYNLVLFRNTWPLLRSMVTTKLVFRCHQSSKRTSQETAVRFNRVKRWYVCQLWLVDFDPFCFCFSRLVSCRHNYDWRKQKMDFVVTVDLNRGHTFLKRAITYTV